MVGVADPVAQAPGVVERQEHDAPKGEVVIVVGPGAEVAATEADADTALAEALARVGPAEAASEVAAALGLNRRDLYRRALALKGVR